MVDIQPGSLPVSLPFWALHLFPEPDTLITEGLQITSGIHVIDQTISHYHITAKLGEGGMGEVYLAQDTKLDRKVALKFLPESVSQNPDARERLLREAKSASRITHPNILTVYSVESADDRDFIVMEYVDGLTLEDYIEQQHPKMEDILGIAVGTALGLAKAHQAGIVHRDLKPSNILIDSDRRARIFDFGLAKLPGVSKLTQAGSTIGTYAYMSPEQGRGDDADARSDIFSFGVILYEIIAGRTPFQGDHEAAILYSTANEDPEPLTRFKSDVPDELQRIVGKCLAKRPQDRYQSAADLATDLKQIRRSVMTGSTISHFSQPPPKPSRTKWIVSGTAVAVVVLMLLILRPWKIAIEPTHEAGAGENRLAVMYFDNVAEPGDPQRLGEIATNLLITDLSGSQQMQVVSSQRLYDILKLLGHEGEKTISPDIATQVAQKAGARWMMTGSILKTTPNIVVTAQIVDVTSGNTVASQRITGQAGEDIFPLVDQLTVQVKQGLSIPSDPDGDRPVILSTTPSRDAYRLYLEGIELVDRYKFLEALEKFKEVIAIDSTFAMAYYRAAMATYQSGEGSQATVRQYVDPAVALMDRVNAYDKLHIQAISAGVRGNSVDAVRYYTRLTEEYPDDKSAWVALSTIQSNWLNDREASIPPLLKAIEIDPLYKIPYNQLAYHYSALGDYEKSLWAINKYIELAPGEPNPYDSRGELYGFHGQLDDAIASFKKALEIDPEYYGSRLRMAHMHKWKGWYTTADSIYSQMLSSESPDIRADCRYFKATVFAAQGQMRAAIDYLHKAVAADELDGTLDEILDKQLMITDLWAELGDTVRALSHLRHGIAGLDSTTGFEYAAMRELEIELLAEQNQLDAASAALKSLDFVYLQSNPPLTAIAKLGEAKVASHRGDHTTALARMEEVLALDDDFSYKYLAGTFYLRAGQIAKVVSHYERLVDYYDVSRSYVTHFSAAIHYQLGIAYEESGWTDKAVEQYEKFLALWGNGDPELVKVVDTRARMARLKAQS